MQAERVLLQATMSRLKNTVRVRWKNKSVSISFLYKIMREHDFCAIRSKTLLLTYENQKSIIGENEKPHMYSYAQKEENMKK